MVTWTPCRPREAAPATARLDIFVGAHCFGYQEARRQAAAVAKRFQAVTVRLIDLDAEPEARPECVIAVPTYVRDDTTIAMGNPRQADPVHQVGQAVAAERVHKW